jgi:hypothetical protein
VPPGIYRDKIRVDVEHESVDRPSDRCQTQVMTVVPASAIDEFVDAILARDFSRARGLIHPDIDFRAMTPSRVWEADGPAAVEQVLRAWFDHPDRDVERVEPTKPASVGDTLRVGWRVHGHGADGPFLYEQQAYVREDDAHIVWLRIMCCGPRPSWPATID